MFEEIKACKKCNLYLNQEPLLDKLDSCDIMWVGLSAKLCDKDKNCKPLAIDTKSGKILSYIEELFKDVTFYKTNLVKCAPLDDVGKLRYPKKEEMDSCVVNLRSEIDVLRPKVVILLGSLVIKTVSKEFNFKIEKFSGYNYYMVEGEDVMFLPIHHPSYISVYRRKETIDYLVKIKSVVNGVGIF